MEKQVKWWKRLTDNKLHTTLKIWAFRLANRSKNPQFISVICAVLQHMEKRAALYT